MLDLKEGMVIEKEGVEGMWLLINGGPGQYGSGVVWAARKVMKRKDEYVISTAHPPLHVDTIDHSNPVYSLVGMVKPRYFHDANRTDYEFSAMQKDVVESARKKLTAAEYAILKAAWEKDNG